MTTTTLEPMLEFRCNRCWHSNCVSCELSGKSVACSSCGEEVSVPEATPERIARAAERMATQADAGDATLVIAREKPFEEMSAKELRKLEQEETHVAYSEMDFHSVPLASCLARLAAQIIDGFANGIVIVVGAVMVFAAVSSGLIDIVKSKSLLANIPALAIGLFPFLALQVIQWNLIATRGQTIGKIMLWIRIIDCRGNAPGFVQGVILRDWLRMALSFIPFFSIVDAALILTESKRCIHDYIAGTRVVPAR